MLISRAAFLGVRSIEFVELGLCAEAFNDLMSIPLPSRVGIIALRWLLSMATLFLSPRLQARFQGYSLPTPCMSAIGIIQRCCRRILLALTGPNGNLAICLKFSSSTSLTYALTGGVRGSRKLRTRNVRRTVINTSITRVSHDMHIR